MWSNRLWRGRLQSEACDISEMSNTAPSSPGLGQRHVLAICAHFGLVIVYCMRVNLSVALVSMVNSTDSGKNISGQCPLPSTNSTPTTFNKGKFTWSRELQGFILSGFFWGYIFLQIPAGNLAQRYGAKWIFGIGVIWTAALTLLTPVTANLNVYLFIFLRFLEGVGESVTFPAIMAMLGRWSPREESSFLYTLVMNGGAVGTIIGQITSGPLCDSNFLGGWPSVFYTNGAVGLIWFIPWYLLVFDSPQSHPRISDHEKIYILESNGGNQEDANKRPLPWKLILSTPGVWVYVFCSTVAAWIAYTLLTCLPQFLSDVLHFDLTDNGIVASSPYIAFFIFSNIFSYICDTCVNRGWMSKTKVKKIFTLVCMWGCGGCLFAITFVSCNKAFVITLLIVGYSFYSAVYAGFYSNSLDMSPDFSGTIFGIGNVFSTAAGIITPLLTDAITKHGTVEEWNTVFYLSSSAAAVGGLAYLILGTSERQDWSFDTKLLTDSYTGPESGSIDENSPLLVNTDSLLDVIPSTSAINV